MCTYAYMQGTAMAGDRGVNLLSWYKEIKIIKRPM